MNKDWKNDFVKMTTKLEDALLSGFGNDKTTLFLWRVANSIIAVSRDLRLEATHVGIVEAGLRRAVKDRLEYHGMYRTHTHPEAYENGIVEAFMHDMGLLRRIVLHRLREERNELFPASYYTDLAEPAVQVIEHPMRTFGRFLDELEYVKQADSEAYGRSFRKHREVMALYRVGLAILPTDTWEPQIRLSPRVTAAPLPLAIALKAGARSNSPATP